MISGDPQTASSAATGWPCPEVRLEHFKRGRGWRGSERLVVQPTVTAPQLTFITEGDEGHSSWAPTSENSREKGGNKARRSPAASGAGNAVGRDSQEEAGVAVLDSSTDAGAADGGCCGCESGGGSHPSSLQPTDGSSVRTSLSSYNSSSNNGSNNQYKTHTHKLKKTSRPKSEERAKMDQLSPDDDVHPKPCAASASSIPTVPVSSDQGETPSWRERVQKQQQKLLTPTGDNLGDGLYPAASRWAVARRQEELSSVAHARRIKHLIEQSRQRGPGAGLTLGRSVSEESGRDARPDKDFLRVEGQHKAQPRLSHILPTMTTMGLPTKGAYSEGADGIWTDMLPSPHRVLPPVRKLRGESDGGSKTDLKPKQQASEKPVLGDLLEAQTFFSHGISVGSADNVVGKKHNTNHHHNQHQHQHRHQPLVQQGFTTTSTQPKHCGGLAGALGPHNTAGRLTLATAAIVGEPPQPRLKYTAAFQHKLTGSCLP
ncbi:hypothetical protein ElyMa_002384400 [Elysia marginata]|uniref:Nuclear protein MDM1 n=1 Tax=Elysia marginata TaxID=1093978 RepID=A0AAV4GC40_9GAST|nr:hypothetical protein ElyMa_002384400 [Elysia marginata]